MDRAIVIVVLTLCCLMGCVEELSAQKYPERKHIRRGNRAYVAEDFAKSDVEYMRALDRNAESRSAIYNLASSYYRQERYEEAGEIFGGLAEDNRDSLSASEELYNLGNSLFEMQKLKESLEAYKEAIRKNPNDFEAKYNYSIVKRLLNQQEDDDGGGGGEDDQDQDQDQQDQDQDQGEDDKDKGDEDKPGDQKPEDQKPGEGREQPSGMSREDAERMLDAMQVSEDRTQEKINEDKDKAATVGRSGKNW